MPCFMNLPQEILDQICEHVHTIGGTSLKDVCCLNKRLCQSAQPILLRNLQVNLAGHGRPELYAVGDMSWLPTLSTSTGLVERIKFYFSELSTDDEEAIRTVGTPSVADIDPTVETSDRTVPETGNVEAGVISTRPQEIQIKSITGFTAHLVEFLKQFPRLRKLEIDVRGVHLTRHGDAYKTQMITLWQRLVHLIARTPDLMIPALRLTLRTTGRCIMTGMYTWQHDSGFRSIECAEELGYEGINDFVGMMRREFTCIELVNYDSRYPPERPWPGLMESCQLSCGPVSKNQTGQRQLRVFGPWFTTPIAFSSGLQYLQITGWAPGEPDRSMALVNDGLESLLECAAPTLREIRFENLSPSLAPTIHKLWHPIFACFKNMPKLKALTLHSLHYDTEEIKIPLHQLRGRFMPDGRNRVSIPLASHIVKDWETLREILIANPTIAFRNGDDSPADLRAWMLDNSPETLARDSLNAQFDTGHREKGTRFADSLVDALTSNCEMS